LKGGDVPRPNDWIARRGKKSKNQRIFEASNKKEAKKSDVRHGENGGQNEKVGRRVRVWGKKEETKPKYYIILPEWSARRRNVRRHFQMMVLGQGRT